MAVNATHRAHAPVNVCYSKTAPVHLPKGGKQPVSVRRTTRLLAGVEV